MLVTLLVICQRDSGENNSSAMNTTSAIDVLSATLQWLIDNGYTPLFYKTPNDKDKSQIQDRLRSKGYTDSVEHINGNPSIVALHKPGKRICFIECIGIEEGESPNTQREKFASGIGRATFNYVDSVKFSPDSKLIIGLALPSSPIFLGQLKKHIRIPLRKRLNMWIFLFDRHDGRVSRISPDSEITPHT